MKNTLHIIPNMQPLQIRQNSSESARDVPEHSLPTTSRRAHTCSSKPGHQAILVCSKQTVVLFSVPMILVISNNASKRLLSQPAFERCGILFSLSRIQICRYGSACQLLPVPGLEELFEEVEAVLNKPIKKLCLKGLQEELDRTVNCQPAVMLASLAVLKKLLFCISS